MHLRPAADVPANRRYDVLNTSPIRHFVRVALGALAGVAIGLGGFGPTNRLSAAALAFLAGYAVEPVFGRFAVSAAEMEASFPPTPS
jgi:hypothetical protein